MERCGSGGLSWFCDSCPAVLVGPISRRLVTKLSKETRDLAAMIFAMTCCISRLACSRRLIVALTAQEANWIHRQIRIQ